MTLVIGLITGGKSPANQATIRRIEQISAAADDVNGLIPSDFNFDLTFKVSGPVWQPKQNGLVVGRLSSGARAMTAEIGVPETFSSDVERDKFLRTTIADALDRTEVRLRQRGLTEALRPLRKIVGEVLSRSLDVPNGSNEPGTSEVTTSNAATEVHSTRSPEISQPTVLKLYLSTESPAQYWEAWALDRKVVIHTGSVGKRGEVDEIADLDGMDPQEYILAQAAKQVTAGFEVVAEVDQTTLVVQLPAGDFPRLQQAFDAWDDLKHRFNEELGWLGVGRCVSVDYSETLSFSLVAIDEHIGLASARSVLEVAGYADTARIAVYRDGEFIVAWPDDQIGSILNP